MLPFAVTRPNRQAAATIAMVALTVLPTLYVARTAWMISKPGHRHEVEAELSDRLGLRVTIESVRYPRPGEVIYTGVVLRQEEPRRNELTEVGRASTVRLRRGNREVTIEADDLKIRAESPKLAMAQVGALLQRSGDASIERAALTAPTLDLDLGAGIAPYQLREVVGNFSADTETPTLQASYRVVSPGATTRCELSLSRDRKAEAVRTTLTFRTMEGLPLPAKVLDPFFDSAEWLGPAATVDGALSLHQDGAKEWEAEFQGNLHDIDLTELVNKRFPKHRMSGKARLAVSSAKWADRPGQGYGWVEAAGDFSTGPGVVGFGLLQALRTEMKFRPGPRLARIVSSGIVDLEFQRIAMTFAMTGDGEIRIGGGLGSEYADGAVIAAPSTPLVFAPQGAANVRGLIKTLFPVTEISHGEMVPLTEKSRLLLCLPLPPDLKNKPIGAN